MWNTAKASEDREEKGGKMLVRFRGMISGANLLTAPDSPLLRHLCRSGFALGIRHTMFHPRTTIY